MPFKTICYNSIVTRQSKLCKQHPSFSIHYHPHHCYHMRAPFKTNNIISIMVTKGKHIYDFELKIIKIVKRSLISSLISPLLVLNVHGVIAVGGDVV